jgi:hypothetical protein
MGLLQPPAIAKDRWQRLGIDIITDLPISGKGHDCIVMFIDHMIYRVYWRAYKKIINAPAFARLFIDNIFRQYRVPQVVLSNCNIFFKADYWSDVTRILQTKIHISMVFHPDTDSLSENSNKMIIHKLRGITTHHLANWDDYLPLAEYA